MNIEQAKKNLINTLESIDRDKLSLPDLKLYAEILKTISEIQTKSCTEFFAEAMSAATSSFGSYKAPAISEMK